MTLNLTINGVRVEAEEGESLLDVARRNGFEIPSLCHHEAVAAYGACRLCLVEVTKGGRKKLTTSCNYEVLGGIEVVTESAAIRRHRAMVLELILAEAPESATVKALAAEYGVTRSRFAASGAGEDRDGCILCGLCARVCAEVVGANALTFRKRGDNRQMGTPFVEEPQTCIACGACAWVCPTSCVGFDEQNGERKVHRWKRSLPLAKTEKGHAFAPQFQLFHFRKLAKLEADFYKKAPGER